MGGQRGTGAVPEFFEGIQDIFFVEVILVTASIIVNEI